MEHDITIETLGKQLGIGRNSLYNLLRTCDILSANNLPHTRYRNLGLFRILPHEIPTQSGVKLKSQTLLTPKGAGWLRDKLSYFLKELSSVDALYQAQEFHSITK